ncbi:MAG TPA: hypothetical protein VNG04_05830 [Candidatus Acidoferrum sp.]|nr:hypothetical protein [Candidatus Acidoferrum sp.]
MTESAWPAYVDHVFRCTCGEEIGEARGLGPARSVEDGRELGPSYLMLKPNSLSGAVCLWKEGTGDAGFYDQRCPGCGALLVAPPDQESLF